MSGANRVILTGEGEAAIRRHGEERYPFEACGALVGDAEPDRSGWTVLEIVPAPNEHDEDQRRRYRIPPEFQLRVERAARGAGRDVVGYYHSHPDHPARPSEYDRSHAWPGYVYVICAVREGRAEELAAFTLDEIGGSFSPLPVLADRGAAG